MTDQDQRLGQLNYAGYVNALPTKTTWDGKPLPAWRASAEGEKELTDAIRGAWQGGAERVIAEALGVGDVLLLRLELATLRRVAGDDFRGGEGPWAFRVEGGTYRVALPPKGTHESTMQRLAPLLIADLGGGYLERVIVDPASGPNGPRRLAFVIEGGQAPADLLPSPPPTGTGSPGSPPPPAQGGD
jgi:hypothetical protein